MDATTQIQKPESGRWPILAALAYLSAFVVVAVAAGQRSPWGVAIGALLLFGAALWLSVSTRRPSWARGVAVGLLIAGVFGVVPIALWADSNREGGGLLPGRVTNGWGFLGACSVVVGFGLVLTAIRRTGRWTTRRGALVIATVLLASALAVLVPLWVLSDGVPVPVAVVMAAGVLVLVPAGLSLLTEAVVDAAEAAHPGWVSRSVLRWAAIVGVVLAATGVGWLAAATGIGVGYVPVIALVLLVLVGAIASDTPADVVLVVAVVALTWSFIPREVKPDAGVQPSGQQAIVALGDSYMSGEGARRYYQGTNEKGRNECRRAQTAYAPVTVSRDGPPERLAFVACSGAHTLDIYESRQQPGDPVGGPPGGLNQLAHVDWLQDHENVDVQLVIVSIGGNDALFGEIGQACVAPGDCTEVGAHWLAHLTQVAPQLHATYQMIRDHFGASVPVLVVPYPIPLSPVKCSWSLLTENEHVFLYGYTVELNKVLRQAATDAGLYYLDGMANVLDEKNLRICDDSADKVGVNFLAMNSVGGLTEQIVNPQNWFHNSMHPNERGHQAMAEVLQAWLAQHQNPAAPSDPGPALERQAEPAASMDSIMDGRQFHQCGVDLSVPRCSATTTEWIQGQYISFGRRSIAPLLLILAGTLLIWFWLIRWWRDVWPGIVRRGRKRPAEESRHGGPVRPAGDMTTVTSD